MTLRRRLWPVQLGDLFEVREASLYHGTSVFAAIKVIANDMIGPSTDPLRLHGYPDGTRGASLSRSRKVALSFGSVVFELDPRIVRQHTRVVPFDYWAGSAEVTNGIYRRRHYTPDVNTAEAEEFAIDGVRKLSRCLRTIWIKRNHRRALQDDLFNPDKDILLKHPLLKIVDPQS